MAIGGTAVALALTAGLGVATAKAPPKTRTVVRITCRTNATYVGVPLSACVARVYGAKHWSKRVPVVYVGNHTYPTGRALVRAYFRGDRRHRASAAHVTFRIAARQLTYDLQVASKPYDGTTTAQISACALTGVLPRDNGRVVCDPATVNANFASPAIATFVTVSLSGKPTLVGAAARGYSLAGVGPLTSSTADITAEPLIIDSDLYTDAGDAGGIAIADVLQLKGEAKVVATILNTRKSRPAIAADSINCVGAISQFYGVSNGIFGADGAVPHNGGDVGDPGGIAECAAQATGTVAAPIPAVTAYRRALVGQPNHSVVIASIGYFENLQALLASGPDATSPLTGLQLVQLKVRELVAMDGCFPLPTSGSCNGATNPYNNAVGNAAAASYVASHWPTKVVWSGYEFGDAIHTGGGVSGSQPTYSPIRAAYEKFALPNNWIQSFDQATVYHAVRPWDSAIGQSAAGSNAINAASGANTFTAGGGNDVYLTINDLNGVQSSIDTLLNTVSNGVAPNDNFNSGFNSTLWSTSTSTAAVTASSTVGVNAGQLEISHTGTAAWSSGTLRTQLPFDISGKAATVQLVRAANDGAALVAPAVGGETSFRISSTDGTHYAEFTVAGSYIGAVIKSGATESTVNSIPYSAANMQWLRIRQTGGSWYFEYSADNVTWHLLASSTVPGLSTTSVNLSLIAGSDVTPATDIAQFDNITTG
jgi:hypothetical protein